MNPYFQVFCCAVGFQIKPPCHATELVKFRQRIGEEGAKRYLDYRLSWNWLRSSQGDAINLLMAVCVWNVRKWREVKSLSPARSDEQFGYFSGLTIYV